MYIAGDAFFLWLIVNSAKKLWSIVISFVPTDMSEIKLEKNSRKQMYAYRLKTGFQFWWIVMYHT